MRVDIRLVLAVLSALLLASPAAAQLHLAWDDCGAAGATLKSSACDQDRALNDPAVPRLYASFDAPAGTTKIIGMEAYVQVAAAVAALPDWWRLEPGGCRPTSLHAQFITPCASALDYWGSIPGGAVGGFAYLPDYQSWGANTALIKLVAAVDATQATELQGGSEYYAFTLVIDQQKTVGAGSCAGCATGAAIAFAGLRLVQPTGVGDLRVLPAGASPSVSWQCRATVTGSTPISLVGAGSGNDLVWADFGFDCTTPTTPRTWGQIKSLYR